MTKLLMNNKINNKSNDIVRQILYSMPVFSTSILYGGPLVILQGVYIKYFNIPLTTIALILLIANLFDTVTDPLVGYLSDKYYEKNQTYKPFIFSGALLFILAAFFLFTPPDYTTGLYLLVCFLVFFLSFTIFNISHNAWGCALSVDSNTSTNIFTVRAIALLLGGMVFYGIPQLPMFESTEFTPKTLEMAVYISAMLIVPSLYLALKLVPNSDSKKMAPSKAYSSSDSFSSGLKRTSLMTLWLAMKTNKPLGFFLGSFFFSGIGAGSWGALIFIYVDSFLNKGEWFSIVALIGMGVGAIGLKLWGRIAICFGKRESWLLATLVTVIGILAMMFLSPTTTCLYSLAFVIGVIFLGINAFSGLAPALLSDIVDYSTLKSGKALTGSFYSIYFLMSKVNVALGGALGLSIVGLYGYEILEPNSKNSIFGLQLASVWLPSICLVISIFFILRIKIDSRRHAIIVRALGRR